MRKSIFFLCIIFLSGYQLKAGYSGTYFIGPVQYFSGIQEAFDSLMIYGISNPVNLKIISGTYSGDFSLGLVPGNNYSSIITISSVNNNPDSVIIKSLTGFTPTFNIQNAFLSFENLTIRDTCNYSNDNDIILKNSHVIIKSCKLFTNLSDLISGSWNSQNYIGLKDMTIDENLSGSHYFINVIGPDSISLENCNFTTQHYCFLHCQDIEYFFSSNCSFNCPANISVLDMNNSRNVIFINNTLDYSFSIDGIKIMLINNEIKSGRYFNTQADTLIADGNYGGGEIGQSHNTIVNYAQITNNNLTGDVYVESQIIHSSHNTGSRHVYTSVSGYIFNNDINIIGLMGVTSTFEIAYNHAQVSLNFSSQNDTIILHNNTAGQIHSGGCKYLIGKDNVADEFDLTIRDYCLLERNDIEEIRFHFQHNDNIYFFNNFVKGDADFITDSIFCYHNNFAGSVQTSGSYAEFYNNNLISPVNMQSVSSQSDYNNYFPVIFTEPHSMNVDPVYMSAGDLHATNIALYMQGMVNTWVTDDKDRYPRPVPPSIGANETDTIALQIPITNKQSNLIYPAISNGNFKIIEPDYTHWKIISSEGKIFETGILEKQYSKEYQFSLLLPSGMYFLVGDEAKVQKFIIAH